MLKRIRIIICGLLCATAVFAQEVTPVTTEIPEAKKPICISLQGGTQGVGAEIKFAFGQHFFTRIGYHNLPYTYTAPLAISGISTDASLKTNFSNTNLFFEWKPGTKSNFRFVFGAAYFMNAEVSANLKPTSNYTVSTITLTKEDIGDITINTSWKGIAPYLGIGIFKPFPKHFFNINFDLGAYYLSQPNTTVTGTKRLSDNAQVADQINTNTADYRWMPLLQIGLNFKLH